MKNISILGSTGSIGRSTLDVISRNPDRFKVVALAAGRNLELLEEQIRFFSPEIVAVADAGSADALHKRMNGLEILAGPEGMSAAAAHGDADIVISAIVGSAGLLPTITAVQSGKTVGIANKESLVMAGGIVMAEAKKENALVIPVDSEHSAVFQCLEGRSSSEVRRIVLTASGGPFLTTDRETLREMRAADALRHPNWAMGPKITVDSATLMNKGLEVIEACWLFDAAPERVDVLIHPQSIVHSMVEFRDRSLLAQLSVPDMRGPISYALSYPERIETPIRGLDLEEVGSLTFLKPDTDRFPCLMYAYEALRAGGTTPAVLNAANEVAVNAFLADRIGFADISIVIRRTVDDHVITSTPGLEAILDADRWARERAESLVKEAVR